MSTIDEEKIKYYASCKKRFIDSCSKAMSFETPFDNYSIEFANDASACQGFLSFLNRVDPLNFEKQYNEGLDKLKKKYNLPEKYEDLIYHLFNKSMVQSIEFAIKTKSLEYAVDKGNKSLCLLIAEIGGDNVSKYMTEELKKDNDFLLELIKRNPNNIKHMENKKNPKFLAEAFIINNDVILSISNKNLLKEVYQTLISMNIPESELVSFRKRIVSLEKKRVSKTSIVKNEEKRNVSPKKYVTKGGALAYAPSSSKDQILL